MMASSTKYICTFCNTIGISKAAVTWCNDCEIFFCGECEKSHKTILLYHNTMPSQDYHGLPKLNQAQCIPGMDINKPSELKRLTIPQNMKFLNIRACLVLPDGRVIILDYNAKQLLLFSDGGIFMKTIVTFQGYPFDVCLVEKNIVAVILESPNQTKLVDVKKNTIVKTIELSHYCYGVASDGKNLILSSDGKNLILSSDGKNLILSSENLILSSDGKNLAMGVNSYQITKVNLHDMSVIILDGVKELNYIELFQGNIYGTNSSENTVCCYKSTGEPVLTFQHQHITTPGGLSLDKNGFVYIASQKNDSIVAVSPDGKTCRTILSEADGIKSPWAIDINREKGIMVVSSYMRDNGREEFYDTAFIYEI